MSSDVTEYTILIVDDEDMVLRVLERVLACSSTSDLTYLAVTAASADKALEALQRNHIDCALLDYNIGDVGGLSLMDEMHELDPTLPIIMMSGLSDDETIGAAMRRGAVDWLSKGSMSVEETESMIAGAISRREQTGKIAPDGD